MARTNQDANSENRNRSWFISILSLDISCTGKHLAFEFGGLNKYSCYMPALVPMIIIFIFQLTATVMPIHFAS